jgi:hypothetical protein
MNVLSRRLGLLVAATGAVLSLVAVPAPAASAATPPGPAPAAPAGAFAPGAPPAAVRLPLPAVVTGRWSCRPVHSGPSWRWDEMRRGSHWDHREWNPRTRRVEWRHYWRDDRYCVWIRVDGPPTGRGANRPGDNRPVGNRPVGNQPVGNQPVGNGAPPPARDQAPPPRRF